MCSQCNFVWIINRQDLIDIGKGRTVLIKSERFYLGWFQKEKRLSICYDIWQIFLWPLFLCRQSHYYFQLSVSFAFVALMNTFSLSRSQILSFTSFSNRVTVNKLFNPPNKIIMFGTPQTPSTRDYIKILKLHLPSTVFNFSSMWCPL